MLVHAGDGGVDRRHPVQITTRMSNALHVFEDVRPDAVAGPPVEVAVDRVPVPEPLRQVAPGCARPEPPRHGLDDRSPIDRRTPSRLRWWEQRADELPYVSETASRDDTTRASRDAANVTFSHTP